MSAVICVLLRYFTEYISMSPQSIVTWSHVAIVDLSAALYYTTARTQCMQYETHCMR